MRNHQKKDNQESLIIKSAKYINDFTIAITFSNNKTKLVDFIPLFHKYVKGENLDYFAPEKFKKFIVKNGNIYWGKNEDVIFPAELLFNKISINEPEEILYIF